MVGEGKRVGGGGKEGWQVSGDVMGKKRDEMGEELQRRERGDR